MTNFPQLIKISVIIPVFNGANTISKTLDSVLGQTYQNWEIVVVNDGSTDETLDTLRQYQHIHPELGERFRILSFANAGVSISRNRGIAVARGEYIAFLDADDLWTPEKLEDQWGALQKDPRSAVAYSFTERIDEQGKLLGERMARCYEGDVYTELLELNFVASGSNPLVKRSALDAVGEFKQDLHWAEDWDLWLRLARQFNFVCVPKFQVLYRKRSSSASNNISMMAQQACKIIKREIQLCPDRFSTKIRNRAFFHIYEYLIFKAIERPLTRSKGKTALGLLLKLLRYNPNFLNKRRKTLVIIIAKIIIALIWPRLGDRRWTSAPLPPSSS